jgi:hypothetical protein
MNRIKETFKRVCLMRKIIKRLNTMDNKELWQFSVITSHFPNKASKETCGTPGCISILIDKKLFNEDRREYERDKANL